MDEQDKIRLLREKIEAADAIVVGGASGMSAASGFKFYYADDDVFKKIAGGLYNPQNEMFAPPKTKRSLLKNETYPKSHFFEKNRPGFAGVGFAPAKL